MYVIFWQNNKDEPMFNATSLMIIWARQQSPPIRENS